MTDTSVSDERLAAAGAGPGDRVRVTTGERTFEGLVMPRHAFSAPNTLVLKLDSGYNVGLRLAADDAVELVRKGKQRERRVPPLPDRVAELPIVSLLGTGGTIASFVEYRTGAVFPATTPEELAAAVPECFEIAQLDPRVVFETFSEDLTPAHWDQLATAVQKAFEDGAAGVVIGHGTDTLHFTAAALQCVLPELPGPVVLVGAQRSSDRPSSDAASNLSAAVLVAAEQLAGEVVIVMHDGMSDGRHAIHAAGRARKLHTSRRDAFVSINAAPIGHVEDRAVTWHVEPRPPRPAVRMEGTFSDDVSLLWSYPGLRAEEIRAAGGGGLVLAGTGLGHIPRSTIPVVRELSEQGTVVVVASQCLAGRTNLRVYETGRELVRAGAIEAGDMMPETAFAKLAWALGTASGDADEARKLFLTPRGREMDERSSTHHLEGVVDPA